MNNLKVAKKERHFERLKETSEAVWPVIADLVVRQYQKDDSFFIKEDMNLFLERRLGHLLLRPYLTRLAYELAGGGDWKSILKLLAAVELFNISTYQSNICFDEKANIDKSNFENQFISSMFSLSLAHIAISEHQWVSTEAKSKALELLARCNIEVYEGQFIDINILSLNNQRWKFDVPIESKKAFLPMYIRRCELIGGSTFLISVIGSLAAKGSDEVVYHLSNCLRKLGIAIQIINDLADYIPEQQQIDNRKYSRPYTNSYGDLRMGRLTYPTYKLLNNIKTGNSLQNINKRWATLVPTQQELSEFTEALKFLNIRGKVESLIRSKCWNGSDGINCALGELKLITTKEAFEDLLFIKPFIFGSSMLLYFQNMSSGRT